LKSLRGWFKGRSITRLGKAISSPEKHLWEMLARSSPSDKKFESDSLLGKDQVTDEIERGLTLRKMRFRRVLGLGKRGVELEQST